MSVDERNNKVVDHEMDQHHYPPHQAYGFPVNHSNPPPSAPSPTSFVISEHSAPPPQAVVNNIVVNPGMQYHPPATGYVVVQTGPPSLPCCGIGVAWFLFILGWFFGIPWFVGAIILLCSKVDPRERAGYIACTIMAVVSIILVIIIAAKGS